MIRLHMNRSRLGILAVAAGLWLPAAGASGQEALLRFVDSGKSVTESRSADSPAAPPATVGAGPDRRVATEVDVDLLRSGPSRLLIPAPDGRVLAVERSTFEDRGDGNVLWAGRVAGSAAETVVLTVRDGRLVGSFGELGGPSFDLVAGPDGAGTVRDAAAATFPEEEAGWSFCAASDLPAADPEVAANLEFAADLEFAAEHVVAAQREIAAVTVHSVDRPAGIESGSGVQTPTHVIDLLVLYDDKAEAHWTTSGVTAAIQALVDYSNTVLRNNNLDAGFTLAHQEKVTVPVDSGTHQHSSPEMRHLRSDGGIEMLRDEHGADVVVFVTKNSRRRYCGLASTTYSRGFTPAVMARTAFAEVNLICSRHNSIFLHEIGHLAGGSHGDQSFSASLYPYAYGHKDSSKSPAVYSMMRALERSRFRYRTSRPSA